MTKITLISAIAAAMVTTASAEFSLGDMVKDMKDVAISMSKDAKDSVATVKDGMVETTKSAERTVTNVSADVKDSSVKVSDDLKTAEVATSKDSKETVTKTTDPLKNNKLAEKNKSLEAEIYELKEKYKVELAKNQGYQTYDIGLGVNTASLQKVSSLPNEATISASPQRIPLA